MSGKAMSSGGKRRQREAGEDDDGAPEEQRRGVEQRNGRDRRRDKRRRIPYSESNAAAGTAFPSVTNPSNSNNTNASSPVLVGGLPDGCTVLELKSRFEMYGAISRIRIDGSSGFITFRSQDSAQAAISASLDSAFGITLRSRKAQLLGFSSEDIVDVKL